MIDTLIPLRITFDESANAAYIYLVDGIAPGGVASTVQLDDEACINIDFDRDVFSALAVDTVEVGYTPFAAAEGVK